MKFLRNRAVLIIIGLVVIALVLVGVRGLFGGTPAEANVQTVQVTRGDLQATVLSSGQLQPAADVNLNFGSAGTLTQLFVQKGQQVKQGDKLAALDARDLQLAVDQAQANLDSAQAKLDATKAGATT